jgi:hypothetical protein
MGRVPEDLGFCRHRFSSFPRVKTVKLARLCDQPWDARFVAGIVSVPCPHATSRAAPRHSRCSFPAVATAQVVTGLQAMWIRVMRDTKTSIEPIVISPNYGASIACLGGVSASSPDTVISFSRVCLLNPRIL